MTTNTKPQPGQGSAIEHGLDDFLGHSTRAGSGASFLDNWAKQRTPPQVRIVLHTKANIVSVWQHPWPKIVTRERDGKEVCEVWSGAFNSWESEEILQRQYRRDDSGLRENPPQVCPMSLLIEEIERLMREEIISWDTPMFRFVGDDASKAKVLHAGAMCNKTKKIWEGLTDAEKRAARKNGVPSPNDAWKESMMAKCNYVFTVIDFDKPSDGIQIAKETTLIGDKMKKAIRDRITSEGEDKGHPLKNPYVFQWSHDANAKQFQDKYDVVVIAKHKITDEIRELIVDKDPPDISRFVARGNVEDLRASMEDAYCGPEGAIDFDFIFAKAEEILGVTDKGEDDTSESAEDIADDIAGEPEDADDGEDESAELKQDAAATPKAEALKGKERYAIKKREGKGDDERCFAADGVELFGCDECGTVIRDDEEECRKCGKAYPKEAAAEAEPEPEAEPEEEAPPAPRSRSARTATTTASAAPKTAPAGKPATAAASTAKPGSASNKAKASGKDKLGF